MDCRFGKTEDLVKKVEEIAGRPIIKIIAEVDIIRQALCGKQIQPVI